MMMFGADHQLTLGHKPQRDGHESHQRYWEDVWLVLLQVHQDRRLCIVRGSFAFVPERMSYLLHYLS